MRLQETELWALGLGSDMISSAAVWGCGLYTHNDGAKSWPRALLFFLQGKRTEAGYSCLLHLFLLPELLTCPTPWGRKGLRKARGDGGPWKASPFTDADCPSWGVESSTQLWIWLWGGGGTHDLELASTMSLIYWLWISKHERKETVKDWGETSLMYINKWG